MSESRQSVVQSSRKVTVVKHLKQMSINTTRTDRSKAHEHPDVLYLLSTALLSMHDLTDEGGKLHSSF